MLKVKAFKGSNVFMSRNLVPPEVFDSLHDALKLNGAQVFLCCDPSRNGPDDFHIISSSDHGKFEDLRAKGCNLLGPQCVFTCAKEHRTFPKQGFTCCFAMDGVKVLASGFEADEKVKIEKLVTAMGGVFHTKASLDVSFVIVKNVLAAKYKEKPTLKNVSFVDKSFRLGGFAEKYSLEMQWALHILKKPIVTVNWLHQCWNEHRIVPQESFRVLPFSGLTICVTRIPADERKEMEKLISQNGGKYSAELTKKCTHLIADAPEGDKYKVARRWGHIHIVTRKWFDLSIGRKACLNEESYPVQGYVVSSSKSAKGGMTTGQGKDIGISQSVPSSVVIDANLPSVSGAGFGNPDIEVTISQNTSSFSTASGFGKGEDNIVPSMQFKSDANLTNPDNCVANDSESDHGDLYLSECRIFLVGFEASEMRRLVNMIRRGGGSRYILFNDKMTHIIVGSPSETEKKEVRGFAASGIIHFVKATWLEDCDRDKKEVPVNQNHIANDLLAAKGVLAGATGINQGRISAVHHGMPPDQLPQNTFAEIGMFSSMAKNREEKTKINMKDDNFFGLVAKSFEQNQLSDVIVKRKGKRNEQTALQKIQHNSVIQSGKSPGVFKGKVFCFSNSFPEDRKAEILQWLNQGDGKVIHDNLRQNVHFTIECHGAIPKSSDASKVTCISSHWIRSCLEDGSLLDVNSHILYSPLPCQIPLPGFGSFRFCVSQYEEKDRLLLRNLCFVLGAKFVEKLTKKVTHLLCKFASGPKYEAACKWGIESVTSEWIYDCVKQNKVVSKDPFHPMEVTSQDKEAGLCTMSQFPTQAARLISSDIPTQFPSQLEDKENSHNEIMGFRSGDLNREDKQLSNLNKKARILEDGFQKDLLSSEVQMHSTRNNTAKDVDEVCPVVPDVAAAIEDLLEQTSKIHDQQSPDRTGCDKSLFQSNCSIPGQDISDTHSVIGLSKHWLNRTGKKDDIYNSSRDVNVEIYAGFSETQTESQLVGYEEDLSGRQMLIDKVRTQSSIL